MPDNSPYISDGSKLEQPVSSDSRSRRKKLKSKTRKRKRKEEKTKFKLIKSKSKVAELIRTKKESKSS